MAVPPTLVAMITLLLMTLTPLSLLAHPTTTTADITTSIPSAILALEHKSQQLEFATTILTQLNTISAQLTSFATGLSSNPATSNILLPPSLVELMILPYQDFTILAPPNATILAAEEFTFSKHHQHCLRHYIIPGRYTYTYLKNLSLTYFPIHLPTLVPDLIHFRYSLENDAITFGKNDDVRVTSPDLLLTPHLAVHGLEDDLPSAALGAMCSTLCSCLSAHRSLVLMPTMSRLAGGVTRRKQRCCVMMTLKIGKGVSLRPSSAVSIK